MNKSDRIIIWAARFLARQALSGKEQDLKYICPEIYLMEENIDAACLAQQIYARIRGWT